MVNFGTHSTKSYPDFTVLSLAICQSAAYTWQFVLVFRSRVEYWSHAESPAYALAELRR